MIRNLSLVTRSQKRDVVLHQPISNGEDAQDENTRLIQDIKSEMLRFGG